MNGGNRPKTFLIILGALLLGLAWRYLLTSSGPSRNAVSREAPVASARSAIRQLHPGNEVASLHLANLDTAPPPSLAGRDPWRFQGPPPRRSLPQAESTPIPPPLEASASPQPDSLPLEPTLEYLGSFGPPDRKIAVLSDGKRTFNVLEGEVIEGRFVVERIGYESVKIRPLGIPGEVPKRLVLRRPHE